MILRIRTVRDGFAGVLGTSADQRPAFWGRCLTVHLMLALLASLLLHRLAHQSEGALLGNKAQRSEVLNGLLAGSMLLARDDATLVLHQILASQTTRGVLGGLVPHLCLRSNCQHYTRQGEKTMDWTFGKSGLLEKVDF